MAHLIFLSFYLGLVYGPESGLKKAHITFLLFYLFTWGGLWPRFRPQDGSFYLFTFVRYYLGVV